MVSKKQLMARIHELDDMNRTTSMRAEQLSHEMDKLCVKIMVLENEFKQMKEMVGTNLRQIQEMATQIVQSAGKETGKDD